MATRRPVAVSVVAAALAILGWTVWGTLPIDLLPDLESPTIVVSIRSGDRPPEEMERIYGEQVEQRLFAVRGIRSIEQVARTGRIVGTVGFDWDADMDLAVVEVEKAVGPIRSDPDVDDVLVRHFDPRQTPVLTLGLVATEGGPDLAELRRIARRQVAVALERLEGVAEVRVTGGREREVQVRVDRSRLDAHGITLLELESRLRASNVDISAGTLEEGERVYLVRGYSRFRRPEDVAAVVLRYGTDVSGRRVPVRVGDLATVVLADHEIDHLVRVDGHEGVGLAVYKEAGANTVAVARDVRAALERTRDDLPKVDVRLISDEAGLVVDAIKDVESSALIGIALAVLVLLAFLRSAGPTVMVGTVVPVSLLATLFLMGLAGHGLNVMTLGGLALSAGLLVDNSIVIVESIFRRLGQGATTADAAALGTADVGGAIVASTLTSCAVFLPILFVQGLAARLVTGLAFTVVAAQLVSLAIAVTLTPALARWLLPRSGAAGADPGIARVERLVAWLIRRPVTVVALSVLCVIVALAVLAGLGTELLPPADPRQFALRLVGPAGQRVEATERVVEATEEILREAAGDDLAAILSEVGRLPEDDRFPREEQTEENTARIVVRLSAGGHTGGQVVERARAAVAGLAGVEASWEVSGSSLARALGTTGPPIVVEITGQSLDDLRAAAETVRTAMDGRPGLWNVQSSFEGGPPELRIVLDHSIADGLGVDLDTLGAALSSSLDGLDVTAMTLGDEEQEIVVKLPEVRRAELAKLPVRTASGSLVGLGDVARIESAVGAREIFRRDQRRVARVTARIAPGADFPAARGAAEAALAETSLPPGLTASLAGEEAERARTFDELRLAAILALVLLFMVLAGTFESLIHPVTVLAAVPLALVGVAMVLVPMGRPIGVLELLGLIVLAGVAVNDAILFVDAARQLTEEGVPREAALVRAAGIRLRPILMTTATAVLALLPLTVGADEAARLRSPMAITIAAGLVLSMVASLTVIPCLYLVLDRLRPGRS
jgi:HAE1 family hydrophobic/amphiphilic exporter-1